MIQKRNDGKYNTERRIRRRFSNPHAKWRELSLCAEEEETVQALFVHRQAGAISTDPKLKIIKLVKVYNTNAMDSFETGGGTKGE